MDVALRLRHPFSTVLAEADDVQPYVNSNTELDNFTLPEDGLYIVEAYAYVLTPDRITAGYTLTIDPTPAAEVTATPEVTESGGSSN
jgi:hypothetical protein